MNAIIRSVTAFGGRENMVKDSLMSHLSESVKDIQLQHTEPQDAAKIVSNNDTTNSLCTVLEAIFIHGLKDTFLNRVSQAIGADPDQRPEPTFWGPLLVFSHREIIDQVNSLNLVTTDVGRCRVWLRIALNDCLLSRYLEAMRQDGSALKPYYRSSAFVRDGERLDVAQRLIEGIEGITATLACNSSLLNVWTNTPLLLAGLWTPPLRACPVMSGVDIARTLDDNYCIPPAAEKSPNTSVSLPASLQESGVSNVLPLSEDEALKIILGTPVNDAPISERLRLETERSRDEDSAKKVIEDENLEGQKNGKDIPVRPNDTSHTEEGCESSSVGNSLFGRVGWSSSFDEVMEQGSSKRLEESTTNEKENIVSRRTSSATVVMHSRLRSPSEVQSYHSLLESYNLQYVKTPDMREFLQRFENCSSEAVNPGNGSDDPYSALYGLGFEVVPKSPTSLFDIPEFTCFVQQLGKLARETGLDAQNYTCRGCGSAVGINAGKARVCSFSGGYFCSECHVGEEWIIPARVIHNWDFRRYPVSVKSAAFLADVQHHPLLDLKVLNPRLYLAIEEMTQLQTLRIQLNLLRAYLFTCREPVIEDLQKHVWPREYLYEHVHLYAVSDLFQIPSGSLAQLLQRVVSFGRQHVLNCWLCSQKGFICEVCNNPKVIYPFDVDSTYQCPACHAVFHGGCLNASKPCPKCERRQKREVLPLLEAADL
ncbi:run domain Beclin-1-interacting and cysteine-rich domain-containing protein isoform X1 [Schistocerca nitens]|uniref:run domain Beclin-1-interacting and cysteine-rich domain-containing protein isoform X1 n=1 Tax=Schistocerca nitens TaxID=7011 RepID=UPI00211867B1|nr:run domain Beclin-1-interacting and cysteine-rich domain-containing protein isoform X1 [Schistocerca nitens]XP_049847203.1 run domain Beclin-1-interacting and cysteine-rich domain-containing protein isoform X1 [Schistocerca gregaria]